MATKIALVTGAGGGIGAEISKQLAKAKFTVYATDLDLDLMAHLDHKRIEKMKIDVTNSDDAISAVNAIIEKHGKVDLLVNNAGYAQLGAAEMVPMEAAIKEFDVNLFGYGRMQQAVLPNMRERRSGHIINISSIVGKVSMPGFGWYAASKHAVEAMTDALRGEVAMLGIKVTLIEPGLVATPFIGKQIAGLGGVEHHDDYKPIVEAAANVGSNGEGAKPAQIARAVVRAALKRNPPWRHALPLDSQGLIFVRRWFGDRAIWAIIRNGFKLPKKY